LTSTRGFRLTDIFCAKAQRQQQMFFVRKRSANVASITGFYLHESEAAAATTRR